MAASAVAGTAHARLPASTASVPAARALVRRHLASAGEAVPEEVAADAELCVSELVTNAVVHARSELEVLVAFDAAVVRLEVVDRSSRVPHRVVHSEGAATGRGLEMVRVLSRSWGVEPRPGDGKVVWCELALPAYGQQVHLDVDTLLDGWGGGPPPAAPPERGWVVLQRYPVRRGMRAQEHGEALVRECLLLTDGAQRGSTHAPARLVAMAAEIAARFGQEIAEPQRRRQEAHLRGEASVELRYPVVEELEEVVRGCRDVLDALDTYAQHSALLTLGTPPDVRELRQWVFAELLAQAAGADPTPWPGPLD